MKVHVPPSKAAPLEPEGPEVRRLALVVAHGMGQQVPFQTIEQVALRLAEAARHRGWLVEQEDGAPVTARMEVDVEAAGVRKTPLATVEMRPEPSGPAVSLDVFEGYWAPLTEGRVRARDVVRFLWIAVKNWVRQALAPGPSELCRWIFGKQAPLRAPFGVNLYVLGVCAVLASVAVLLGLTTVAAGVRGLVGLGFSMSWPTIRGVTALTGVLGVYELVSAVPHGLLLALLLIRRRWLRRTREARAVWAPGASEGWRLATTASDVLMRAWYVATVLAAAAAVAAAFFDPFAGWVVEHLRLRELADWAGPTWWAVQVVVWALMVALGLFVRRFVVEYVGDVAVYVTPHALDRFYEIRRTVKRAVREAVKRVYDVKEAGRPRYEGVLVVGHSLGSVVVYDALNALLLEDQARPEAERTEVQGRTRLLLTFGSPLDKTAYFFRQQGQAEVAVREALAASVQPLILDYAYRTFPWINVHSRRDPIGNELNFYDLPVGEADAQRRIHNRVDPDALLPLVAHAEHWDDAAITDPVLAEVEAAARAAPEPEPLHAV